MVLADLRGLNAGKAMRMALLHDLADGHHTFWKEYREAAAP